MKKLTGVLLGALGAASIAATAAQWEDELRDAGYLVFHLSNINVINGLLLTKEQAEELRKLAREVEAVSERPPSLKAPLSPEMDKVRRTYLEARELLLAGKQVPADLEKRVNEARAAESRIVRDGLLLRPAAQNTKCASCHAAPHTEAREGQGVPRTPELERLIGLAHAEGVYGRNGLLKLAQLAPKVDALLSAAQKHVLGSFSCCLVPPDDMKSPERVGQAEVTEKTLDLLRRVRSCPDRLWPLMKEGILRRSEQVAVAVSPGATAGRKTDAKKQTAETLERARSLSDVDFELDKDALSKALTGAVRPETRDFPAKSAYFLLVPGASEVLSAYLKRLAEQKN